MRKFTSKKHAVKNLKKIKKHDELQHTQAR
jgi:hypothetical protein